MAKLLGALLLLGGLAAAAALVPLGGRTVVERWNAAASPSDFARRGWHELAQASGLEGPPRRAATSRAARPQADPARGARPVERHTPADRAALDRLVSERARER
jgi:hypothetical protein